MADLSTVSRDERLQELCGGNPTLRREVLELLAFDGTTEVGAPRPTPKRAAKPPRLIVGQHSYKRVREIGSGGMGTVYLAIRTDVESQQQVALKVLRPGIVREWVRGRFVAERHILASLDHPNIARLLDGGALPDGSPFLVTELVDGESLDRYCEIHELGIEDRARLVRKVCGAVHSAHQQLVVHRDLKPNNILVDADGEPRLLDFGIAKLLDPDSVDWTVAQTLEGMQPMTPRYASPEQIRGEKVTPASDVYSLGVVLYELLAGCSPYRVEDPSLQSWARAVCVDEPLPLRSDREPCAPEPSSAGSQPIPRGLDAVVMKAMQKLPESRYRSAAKLEEDLGRFLEGQPVAALRGRLSRRIGEYLRRR